jgi:hypothetical protein
MYIRGWYLPAVTFESYLCSYRFQKGLGKAFSASVAVICFQLMLNHWHLLEMSCCGHDNSCPWNGNLFSVHCACQLPECIIHSNFVRSFRYRERVKQFRLTRSNAMNQRPWNTWGTSLRWLLMRYVAALFFLVKVSLVMHCHFRHYLEVCAPLVDLTGE